MRSNEKNSGRRALLLRAIDEAFDKSGWLGTNLRAAIRRAPAREAAWPPKPGRRTIAEIVLHCAYWKYAVARRITGGKRGAFPLKGGNWFAVPKRLSERQWKQYVALLDEAHRAFRETVANAPWSRLTAAYGSSGVLAAHVHGIAMHDAYHTGQIKTIRALYKQVTAGTKRKLN